MHEPTARRRGCLFYGCLTLIGCALVAVVAGYFGVRYAVKSAQQLALQYTETEPAAVPTVAMSAAQMADLRQRVATFQTALEHPTNAQQLVLSADELNVLLAEQTQLQATGIKVHVAIDDDQVKGQVSIPLKDLGPLKLDGRYLNGLATFKVVLASGILVVRMEDVMVNGRPLPAPVLARLKEENFAKGLQNDPQAAAWIAKFESLQIKGGNVILRNQVQPAGPLTAPEAPAPPGR